MRHGATESTFAVIQIGCKKSAFGDVVNGKRFAIDTIDEFKINMIIIFCKISATLGGSFQADDLDFFHMRFEYQFHCGNSLGLLALPVPQRALYCH